MFNRFRADGASPARYAVAWMQQAERWNGGNRPECRVEFRDQEGNCRLRGLLRICVSDEVQVRPMRRMRPTAACDPLAGMHPRFSLKRSGS